jgi:hypothetical protein
MFKRVCDVRLYQISRIKSSDSLVIAVDPKAKEKFRTTFYKDDYPKKLCICG